MSFRSHGKQVFYALPLFSLISHYLHKIVRMDAEGMNDCFLLAYPAISIAVMPDSRCAKDTFTATEHAKNARKRARGSFINKNVPNGFQIIRESLKVKGIFKRAVSIILQFWRCGTLKQYSPYITKCITFCGGLQIDCFTLFIPG